MTRRASGLRGQSVVGAERASARTVAVMTHSISWADAPVFRRSKINFGWHCGVVHCFALSNGVEIFIERNKIEAMAKAQ